MRENLEGQPEERLPEETGSSLTAQQRPVKNNEQDFNKYKRRNFHEERTNFLTLLILAAIIIAGTSIALYRNMQRGTYDAMMARAQDLFAQEQYDGALDAFNEAAPSHPDRIEPLLGIAHSAERAGRVGEAIAAYRLSLERLPVDALHLRSQTFYEIGRLYAILMEWESAQGNFEEAIAADVTNFSAYLSLGNSLEEQGKLDGALMAYTQALDLSPSSEPAWEAVNRLTFAILAGEEAERLEQIERQFRQALQSGEEALEDGRFREASDYFAEALAINREDANAWAGFGEARFRLGDTSGAITSMERALERDPEHERARTRLAEIRFM